MAVSLKPAVTPRFSTAARDFLRHLKACGRAPATLSAYAPKLALVTDLLGDPALARLTDRALDEALLRLTKGYPGRSPRTAATMNQYRSLLIMFFTWCQRTGRCERNWGAEVKLARAGHRATVAFTKAETKKFLRTIADSGETLAERDWVLFSLYARAGLRRNEVIGLRVNDFDPVRRRVRVVQTKTSVEHLRPLPADVSAALEKYVENAERVDAWRKTSFLFPGQRPARAMTSRQVEKRFHYWRESAELRDELTIHSFRAGFATRIFKATRDTKLVARALGHRRFASTAPYLAISEEAVADAVDKVFGGGKK